MNFDNEGLSSLKIQLIFTNNNIKSNSIARTDEISKNINKREKLVIKNN